MEHTGSDESIKVFVRVRPPDANLQTDFDNTLLLDVSPPDTIIFNGQQDGKTFTYDNVAGIDATQEEVFSVVGRPIIDSCMCGYNGTIFAYGQTGSGKTFTMIGPPEESDSFTHELRGVIPRSFECLFSHVTHQKQMHGELAEYLCKCSFLEIYNEQVYDLLDPTSAGLHLRENIQRGVYVDGLSEQSVSSARDAYEVLSQGWINRRVASTSMNRESSRSHAVFTLTIESKIKESSNGAAKIRSSQLNLVDLAGSERQRDTHTIGLRLKEAGSINKSLSALGNVIMALVDIAHGKSRHVHYRDSKLTFLLRDSLGGNAKTCLIACVHPSAKCFGETLSTLNFAKRTKMIKNKAVINENTTGNILQLQAEIRKLKELLEKARSGIPVQPAQVTMASPSQASQPITGNGQSARSDEEMKAMLQNSMEARERAEGEKETLLCRIEKLEQLCKKKEKFLQSTKLILKLRENHIANLEKARNNAGLEDLQSETLRLLKDEIVQLKSKLDHHPEVTRYAIENIELKSEVKKLRQACSGAPDLSRELSRAHHYTLQLERQLRHFLGQDRNGMSGKTGILLDFADRDVDITELQNKIKKLQKDLEEANHLLAQEKKDRKLQMTKLEVQLTAGQKSNNELEKTIAALKLKSVIERDTLNDMHMKTIKTMLTPQRPQSRGGSIPATPLKPHGLPEATSKRLLSHTGRSSSMPACTKEIFPSSEMSAPNDMTRVTVGVNTDISTEDSSLSLKEVNGDQFIEVSIQGALTDELKVLQEAVSTLKRQVEAKDTELMKARKENLTLESEAKEISQVLSGERVSAENQQSKMADIISILTAKVAELTSTNSILDGEVEDLRTRTATAEGEMSQVKQKHLQEVEALKLTLEDLENKLQELDTARSNLAVEFERTTEELQALQDQMETVEDELSFKNRRLSECDQLIKEGKEHIVVMETELQTVMDKLSLEVEKNMKLQTQHEESGRDSQQELLKALDENSTLKSDLKDVNEKLVHKTAEASSKEDKLREMEERMSSLLKKTEKDKEDMSLLMTTLQDQKVSYNELEAKLGDMEDNSKDQELRLKAVEHDNESLRTQIKNKEDVIANIKKNHSRQLESKQVESDLLADDVEHLSEQNQKLNKDCEKQLIEIRETREELKIVQTKLSEREMELAKVQSEGMEVINQMRSQVLQGREEFEIALLSEQEAEIEQLRKQQTQLLEAIEGLETSRMEKNQEISLLKSKERDSEILRQKMEILEARCSGLDYQLQADKEETSARILELEKDLKEKEQLCTRLEGEVTEEQRTQDELLRERDSLLLRLQEEEEVVKTSLESQKRCRELEQSYFAEKEGLMSQLSSLMEEKTRLVKELAKLEEQNVKLVGQNNLKQRILYHQQVKTENNILKEENAKLQAGLKKRIEYTRQLESQLQGMEEGSRPQKMLHGHVHSKENICP